MRRTGILALLVTFASLLAGCMGLPAASSTPEAGAGLPPFPKQTSPVHAVLRAGASGQIQEAADRVHEVHILAITDNAQSTVEHEKLDDGQKYWSAQIGIKNVGSSEILAGTWSLTGSDGTTYPRTDVLGLGSGYQDRVAIQPGVTDEGVIAFELPKDVAPKQLQYHVDQLNGIDLLFDAQ